MSTAVACDSHLLPFVRPNRPSASHLVSFTSPLPASPPHSFQGFSDES